MSRPHWVSHGDNTNCTMSGILNVIVADVVTHQRMEHLCLLSSVMNAVRVLFYLRCHMLGLLGDAGIQYEKARDVKVLKFEF